MEKLSNEFYTVFRQERLFFVLYKADHRAENSENGSQKVALWSIEFLTENDYASLLYK